MKTTILMTFFALGSITFALAQATPQVPEFKNVPHLLNADGSLTKLEKQTTEIKKKAKAMGYGGVNDVIDIEGKSSDVRVQKNAEFIVKIDADVDPETAFYLTKAEIQGKGREVAVSHMSMSAGMGGKGKSVHKDDVILKFTKIKDGVYKITPETALLPGEEYVFINTNQSSTPVVFCFGLNK